MSGIFLPIGARRGLNDAIPKREGPKTVAGKALGQRISPLMERLFTPEVEELGAGLGSPEEPGWLDRVASTMEQLLARRDELMATRQELERALATSSNRRTWKQVLKKHIDRTVSSPYQRWLDHRAIGRWMDGDTLGERIAEEVGALGLRLELLAECLGIPTPAPPLDHPIWAHLLRLLADEPRAATRRAAARSSVAQLSVLPYQTWQVPQEKLAHALLERLYSHASDPLAARIAVGLLPYMEEDGYHRLCSLLVPRADHDHFLVRARAVETALTWLGAESVRTSIHDPSQTVRMALVNALSRQEDSASETLMLAMAEDEDEEVRAEVTLLIAAASPKNQRYCDATVRRLKDVRNVARRAADGLGEAWDGHRPPPDVLLALETAREGNDPVLGDRAAFALARMLLPAPPRELVDLPPGDSATLLLKGRDPLDIAQSLTPIAAEDLGYDIELRGPVIRVNRGDHRQARLWRVLHELRHRSPTKRQGAPHLLGRVTRGTIRVPPGRMTEATPTAVPGQRVFAAPYWGWAPYLPSVEDYLDAATAGVIRIVTPRGVTEVHPPTDIFRRLRAWLSISIGFSRFDQLRHASLASPDRSTRSRFVAALQDLGFRTKHVPAGDHSAPPISDLFLSLLAPLAMLVNPYRNTAGELVVVLVILGTLLMISTWSVRGQIRSDRDAIPLVLGGWGTRGKSGSERMKAAIFEGLGIPFFSKTTGCEAMFLHAVPGTRAEEIFLFRPLDMATIWENTNTLSMSRRLGARVYLWECMALASRYVDLLQREWVQDDASTLTNAYPDHEDVQGPTGLDVAESIGNFAPANALLITTEEHMVPVVTWAAKARKSKVIHVRHGEGQRLPVDLRARLPYREHPRNISMVLALATELGIDPLDALVLIGDHVVPDLGALLALPPVRYDGRRMRFINGHSANDLASFQNCWRMVTPAHSTDPNWVVLVVNNRHDRVARSRVFARILVREAPAHRYVLIGSNLQGFQQFVDEALTEFLPTIALGAGEHPLAEQIGELLSYHRIGDPGALARACLKGLGLGPEGADELVEALRVAAPAESPVLAACRRLSGPLASAIAQLAARAAEETQVLREPAQRKEVQESLAGHLREATARWRALKCLQNSADRLGIQGSERALRALWAELTRSNLSVVADLHASGDIVRHQVSLSSPPGLVVEAMGAQNIKGTGLEWVYNWMNLLALQKLLRRLDDPSAAVRSNTLQELQRFDGWSLIACLHAREVLEERPEATALLASLDLRIQQRRGALVRRDSRAGIDHVLDLLERVLEPAHAVWRRGQADLVFRDLCNRRISHPRAALVLRELTELQKGGWLRKWWKKGRRR